MPAALDIKVLEPSFAIWHIHFFFNSNVVHHLISGYLVSLGRLGAALGTESYFILLLISHDT